VVRAGVRLICGDDFGFAMMPHGDYVSEFEVYTKQLDIPALEVLRWASTNGAKVMAGPLGFDRGHGTIARVSSRICSSSTATPRATSRACAIGSSRSCATESSAREAI
jgi:hypothetical protein